MNLLLAITLLAVAMPMHAKETIDQKVSWKMIAGENQKCLCQGTHDHSCGYAAILNSLAFGNDANRAASQSINGKDDLVRLSELEKKFNDKDSQTYSKLKRFRKDGMTAEDLLLSYNELRMEKKLPLLIGKYLNRDTDEKKVVFAKRVHKLLLDSLAKGELPIVSIRSQVARFQPAWYDSWAIFMGGNSNFSNLSRWHSIKGHFITVCGVPSEINIDGSFCIDYLDSSDGKKHQLFAYPDVRNFTAYRGYSGKGAWVKHYPFLVVASPSLFLDTTKQYWNERTIIFLHHAIYKD